MDVAAPEMSYIVSMKKTEASENDNTQQVTKLSYSNNAVKSDDEHPTTTTVGSGRESDRYDDERRKYNDTSDDQFQLPKLDHYAERATALLAETLELVERHQRQHDDERQRAQAEPPQEFLDATVKRAARRRMARKHYIKDRWLLLRDVAATSTTAIALAAEVKPDMRPSHSIEEKRTSSSTLRNSRQSAARGSTTTPFLPLTSEEYAEVHREIVTRDGHKIDMVPNGSAEPNSSTDNDCALAFKMLADAVSAVDWTERQTAPRMIAVRRVQCSTRHDVDTFCTYQTMDNRSQLFKLPCSAPEMMPHEIRLYNARIRKRALDDSCDERYRQLWLRKRRAAEAVQKKTMSMMSSGRQRGRAGSFNPLSSRIDDFVQQHQEEFKYNASTYDVDTDALDDDDDDDETSLADRQATNRSQSSSMTARRSAHKRPPAGRRPLQREVYDENLGFAQTIIQNCTAEQSYDEQNIEQKMFSTKRQQIDYTGKSVYASEPTRGVAGQCRHRSLANEANDGYLAYAVREKLSPRFRRILPEIDRPRADEAAFTKATRRRRSERVIDFGDHEIPFFVREEGRQLTRVDRIYKMQMICYEQTALFAGYTADNTSVTEHCQPFVVTGQALTLVERQKKHNLMSLVYHRYAQHSADNDTSSLFAAHNTQKGSGQESRRSTTDSKSHIVRRDDSGKRNTTTSADDGQNLQTAMAVKKTDRLNSEAMKPIEQFMSMPVDEQHNVLKAQRAKRTSPLSGRHNMTATQQHTEAHMMMRRCFSMMNVQSEWHTTVPVADGALRRNQLLYRAHSAPAVLQGQSFVDNAYSKEAVDGMTIMRLIDSTNNNNKCHQIKRRRVRYAAQRYVRKPHIADRLLLRHLFDDNIRQQFEHIKARALTNNAVWQQTNRYIRLQALDVLAASRSQIRHLALFEKTRTLVELGRYEDAWHALTAALHDQCSSSDLVGFLYRALLEETRLPQRAFLDLFIGVNTVQTEVLTYLQASILVVFARHYMYGGSDNFKYALRAIRQIFDLELCASVDLHRAAASLHYQLHETDLALTHLNEALRLDPCDVQLYLALMQVFWRQRRYDLTLRYAQHALHAAPHIPLVYLMTALLNETRGDVGAAQRNYADFCRIEYEQNDSLCSAPAAFILARRAWRRRDEWALVGQAVRRMHPSDVCYDYRLFYMLGKIRYEQRRWPECVGVLEHCLFVVERCNVHGPMVRAKLLCFLALAYLHVGDEEHAKLCLVRSTSIDGGKNEHALRLLLILRWHWCQYQDDHEAELLFDDAVAHNPHVFAYWYARARFYIAQRRYTRAIHNLSEALRCQPQSVNAYHLRALLKMIGRAMPQALDDLSRAIKIEPDNMALRFLRGFLHHSQQRFDDALDDYNRGAMAYRRAAVPNKAYEFAYNGILHNRALVYLKQRDHRRAAVDLARLVLRNPNTWQYAYALEYAWQRAGMLDLAQRLLESSVQKFPACAPLWNSIGILHFTLQPFRDTAYCKSCFQRALHLDPLNLCARANLALFSLYEGHLWACASRAASLIQMAPTCPDGYHLRALASFCAGHLGLAVADITEAIRIDHERETFMHRALMHLSMHDAPAAHADMKEALKVSPEYAAGHYNLGNLYLYAHQQRAAMYHYRRAFAVEQRHWEARHNHLVALLLNEQYFEVVALADDMLLTGERTGSAQKNRSCETGDNNRAMKILSPNGDVTARSSSNKWSEAILALRARALGIVWKSKLKCKAVEQSMLREIECVPDYTNECRKLSPWIMF